MNKNEVILLYKNGNARRKNESLVTLTDLQQSRYVMIDTSIMKNELSRNFVIIDSSRYLCFTKAIIDYQLYVTGWDAGNNEESEENLEPIHVETTSLSDVINLLNCIDRIYCLNNMILEDETCGEGLRVYVEYFQIVLYQNDVKIYDKYFSHENQVSHKNKNSRYITRIFYSIYSTPIQMMIKNNNYLILTNEITWRIGVFEEYSMLGIPLKESNTITLCRKDEVYRLAEYSDISCTFTVHDESEELRTELNKNIRKGRYDNVENIGTFLDYFMCCYTVFKLSGSNQFAHLEIISNMRFFISMSNLIYNEIYDTLKGDYTNDIFDSVISLNLYKEKEVDPKTIYLNEETMLSINDFLAIM